MTASPMNSFTVPPCDSRILLHALEVLREQGLERLDRVDFAEGRSSRYTQARTVTVRAASGQAFDEGVGAALLTELRAIYSHDRAP